MRIDLKFGNKVMRNLSVLAISLVLSGLFAQQASARVYTDLGGGWNKMKIGYACGKAGGSPYDNGNGTYGCVKKCGHSGDSGNDWCAVQCNGDKCEGNTPGLVKGPVKRHDFSKLFSLGAKAAGKSLGTPPGTGLLGATPGFAPQPPAPTGTPVAPPSPPPPVLR
jgi:hypothetical protein